MGKNLNISMLGSCGLISLYVENFIAYSVFISALFIVDAIFESNKNKAQ